jgi:hypothetical protein
LNSSHFQVIRFQNSYTSLLQYTCTTHFTIIICFSLFIYGKI